MLTPSERERYDRQIMIQGTGVEGQEKLKKSRVYDGLDLTFTELTVHKNPDCEHCGSPRRKE